jgi:hypothetical protein
MMDLGTLSVDVLAGLLVLGWWLAAHPGLAVLALLAASTVTAAIIGAAFARGAIR